MSRRMAGPKWAGWESLAAPQPIEWQKDEEASDCWNCFIAGKMVCSLEKRPGYCDRGHWIVKCYVPELDGADAFPRYYMRRETAIEEAELFLRWRLWKERGDRADSNRNSGTLNQIQDEIARVAAALGGDEDGHKALIAILQCFNKLEADRDHWHEGRRNAMSAGEMLLERARRAEREAADLKMDLLPFLKPQTEWTPAEAKAYAQYQAERMRQA